MTKHAADRAKERSGIELTRDDMDAIREKIKNGECVIRGHRNGGTVYLVQYQGKILMPLMTEAGHIVTFITGNGSEWRKKTYRKTPRQWENGRTRKGRDGWRSEIDT